MKPMPCADAERNNLYLESSINEYMEMLDESTTLIMSERGGETMARSRLGSRCKVTLTSQFWLAYFRKRASASLKHDNFQNALIIHDLAPVASLISSNLYSI